MDVTLLLFAAYREIVGERIVRMQVPPRITAAQLFERLQDEHPELGKLRPYTTFAVNRELVEAHTPLNEGDEVALIQPVAGGAHG